MSRDVKQKNPFAEKIRQGGYDIGGYLPTLLRSAYGLGRIGTAMRTAPMDTYPMARCCHDWGYLWGYVRYRLGRYCYDIRWLRCQCDRRYGYRLFNPCLAHPPDLEPVAKIRTPYSLKGSDVERAYLCTLGPRAHNPAILTD